MKPASEGCVQTMRNFLLGPVQKRNAVLFCFFQKKKKYKRIPASGLGGGIEIARAVSKQGGWT